MSDPFLEQHEQFVKTIQESGLPWYMIYYYH